MFAIFLISLLLLSYTIVYFYLGKAFDLKDDRAIIVQALYFITCSILLTIVFFHISLLLIICCISIVHILINKLLLLTNTKTGPLKEFLFFNSTLIAHLVTIVAAYPFLTYLEPNTLISSMVGKIHSFYPLLEQLNDINLLTYIVLVITGFLFSIKGGTILSLLIINLPKENEMYLQQKESVQPLAKQEIAATNDNDTAEETNTFILEERKKYGKIIGIIERLIIIAAILIHQFQVVIALVTAIKSIGRFKELNNKTSDYYIVGTFASFSIAFFIGFLLLAAKKMLID